MQLMVHAIEVSPLPFHYPLSRAGLLVAFRWSMYYPMQLCGHWLQYPVGVCLPEEVVAGKVLLFTIDLH
jgi:hypothetical protein